jgi:hypothetical protein
VNNLLSAGTQGDAVRCFFAIELSKKSWIVAVNTLPHGCRLGPPPAGWETSDNRGFRAARSATARSPA